MLTNDLSQFQVQKRRQNDNIGYSSRPDSTPPPPPLPAVPPPEVSPAHAAPSGAAQRLDMLVGKKIETPTKKVSFVPENDERRYDDNDNDVQEDKLSRLERMDRDPNVS